MTVTDRRSRPARQRRFGRLVERADGRDFPFYDGDPLALSTWKWLVIIAACIVGFVVITVFPEPNALVALVPRVLVVVIPLGTFIAFTKGRWRALFHRLRWADLGTIVVYWLITLAVSALVDIVSKSVFDVQTTANPALSGLEGASPGDAALFLIGAAIGIFGEELFTFLPFLAVMYWMYAKAGTSRRTAVIVAWLVTAAWFGASHLPTYDWHLIQALVGIGFGRLVISLAFIRTKNILVSTGVHLLDDFSLFTLLLILT